MSYFLQERHFSILLRRLSEFTTKIRKRGLKSLVGELHFIYGGLRSCCVILSDYKILNNVRHVKSISQILRILPFARSENETKQNVMSAEQCEEFLVKELK